MPLTASQMLKAAGSPSPRPKKQLPTTASSQTSELERLRQDVAARKAALESRRPTPTAPAPGVAFTGAPSVRTAPAAQMTTPRTPVATAPTSAQPRKRTLRDAATDAIYGTAQSAKGGRFDQNAALQERMRKSGL